MSKSAGLLFMMIVLGLIGCSKQQKVVFDVESVSFERYSNTADKVKSECSALSEDVKTYMDSGWKVVTSSPKEKVVANGSGSCIGTEYVLEK